MMESESQPRQQQSLRRMLQQDRKRAIRACDGCRRVKEKCDGGVPCRRCIRLRRKCEFLGSGARQPESMQDISKLRQGSHHQVISDLLKRINYLERLLVHYAGNIKLDSESLRVLVETAEDGLPPHPPSQSHDREEYVASHGSDDLGAELENCTVKPLENNITHYSGEFSHWNFSMRIKRWIDHCVPDPYLNENDSMNNVKEYYRAEELQSQSETLVSLSSLPPRYIADFLVQSFFRHAETNYFYVEKGWLLEKLEIAYDHPASMTRRDVGTVCIIFTVLAIGTQYAYLDSQPDEDEELQDADASPFSEDTFGVTLYQQACRLVPDVITVASLESVQACLLLGIYTLPLDTSGLSYIYLNLAVKLAIQNGMHRKQPDEGLDPAIRETRIRVWWTAYTTERRVSIFHGRPVSVAIGDIDVDMPVDRSDLWNSSIPTHTSAMLATLQLHGVLGAIAQEMSAIKKHPKHETVTGLSRLLELGNELHTWWESLPEAITCSDQPPKCSSDRSVMHLRLEYYLVRMFAGRPFILRPSGRSSTGTSSTTSATRSASPKKLDPRALLVSDCVAAALDVVDTCKLLHSSIGLARASYTEFSACRAALLIIISQCLQESTDRIRQALRDGMVMIKIMAAGGESARSEVSLIEAFERAISRLDRADEDKSSESPMSGYAQFKKWEMLWKKDVSGQEVPAESRAATAAWSPRPLLPEPEFSKGFRHGPAARFVVQDATAAQAAALFSGTDLNLESFPQTMYEFSTMFGLGIGPGSESVGEVSSSHTEGWVDPQLRDANLE
ncbi:fungal-specific transcription factor domain-containing protein [Mariannaea sp. PMI_226]|nr:fungal-specific transcription factor domain-containing protein [Mariannaea sp. PMI_226]